MSIKQAIIIAMVCLVCFGASFGIAWMSRPAPQAAHAEEAKPAEANDPFEAAMNASSVNPEDPMLSKTLTEKQLKILVQNLRGKIEEYDTKMADLGAREQQLQLSRQAFAADVNELNQIRVDLVSSAAEIKRQKKELDEYQVKIKDDEAVNLKRTATIYDKMDSSSSSKIMINMCKSNQINDAVKLINYMTERTAAKVLGEIATAEPQIAADMCQGLKRLKEMN